MAAADPSAAMPPGYVPDASRGHGHFRSPGDRWAALTPTERIILVIAALTAVVLLVSLLAASRQPPPPSPDCPSPPCSPPQAQGGNPAAGVVVEPAPDSTAPPLRLGGEWSNDALGIAVEFDPDVWKKTDSKDRSVFLTSPVDDISLLIMVAPAAETTPDALAASRLTFLKTLAPDLKDEPDKDRRALGQPTIGLRRATSTMQVGTYSKGAIPEPWTVVVMSAGDERVSVMVQLVSEDSVRGAAFQDADQVVNAIRWQ